MNTETPLHEPPHPTQAWRIEAIRPGKVKNVNGNQLQAFYCDMEGLEDGWVPSEGVFWQRKAGNSPNVGETVHGTIAIGEYGYRFRLSKADERPQGEPNPVLKQAAGKPLPQTSEAPDARQRSIIRQHSQEMALRFLALQEQQNGLEVLYSPEWLEINLAPIIDWFAADASGNASHQESIRATVRHEASLEPPTKASEEDAPF